ncbi:hypothetical protein OK349_13400 [Sphingomonas sp. BT-65]|uniref:hypothetical protein n=1 Tax=Sphingomonas sp. BT-65 TaxID=2989821 RepID=UPI002236AE67|nr:hypothetical protein [Sphingomonas sp. BT-65]MCW4462706.1 hypothetical protein [Sphingomonas sp. BT-65]
MKTLFLSAAAVAALTISVPASAQLLGGNGGGLTGGITGGLGGRIGGTIDRPISRPLERVPLDRLDAPVEQTTRAAKKARGSADIERSIDRRSGKASASGRADGGIGGTLDNQTSALGRRAGLSGSGDASGSASGGASADLIGTDDIRGATSRMRERAGSAIGTARGTAAGTVERGRGVVDRARGAAGNATSGLGGSVTGSGSGGGSASGSADGGSAFGSAEGSGMASATGNPAAALKPGARVEDARGRLIGKLQQVNRNARGRIESLDVLVGRKVATLPVGNFSASGDVLVSVMSKGDVKDAAEPE